MDPEEKTEDLRTAHLSTVPVPPQFPKVRELVPGEGGSQGGLCTLLPVLNLQSNLEIRCCFTMVYKGRHTGSEMSWDMSQGHMARKGRTWRH